MGEWLKPTGCKLVPQGALVQIQFRQPTFIDIIEHPVLTHILQLQIRHRVFNNINSFGNIGCVSLTLWGTQNIPSKGSIPD